LENQIRYLVHLFYLHLSHSPALSLLVFICRLALKYVHDGENVKHEVKL